MSVNPYDPPSQADTDQTTADHGAVKWVRPLMHAAFLIIGVCFLCCPVIYFGESIRSYTAEIPEYFRWLPLVILLFLIFGGMELGHRLYQTVVWRIFPSPNETEARIE